MVSPFQSFWLGSGVLKTVGQERLLAGMRAAAWSSTGRNDGLTGVVEVVDVNGLDLMDRWQLLGRDGPSAHCGWREVCWLAVGVGAVAVPMLLRRRCAGVGGRHDLSRAVRQLYLKGSEAGDAHVDENRGH